VLRTLLVADVGLLLATGTLCASGRNRVHAFSHSVADPEIAL
jgi:hypothetical protein